MCGLLQLQRSKRSLGGFNNLSSSESSTKLCEAMEQGPQFRSPRVTCWILSATPPVNCLNRRWSTKHLHPTILILILLLTPMESPSFTLPVIWQHTAIGLIFGKHSSTTGPFWCHSLAKLFCAYITSALTAQGPRKQPLGKRAGVDEGCWLVSGYP